MSLARLACVVVPLTVVCAACGDDGSTPGPVDPVANLAREIIDTQLLVDISTMGATARITFGASSTPGASLEIGDLEITSASVPHVDTGARLDLGLAASATPQTVDLSYRFRTHEQFQGASASGYTLIWPYHCGNLFPCHSDPADGTTFSLELAGVASNRVAVYPPAIATEAPSYQLAWAVGVYTEIALGTTTAGTKLSVWHLPEQATQATSGTQNLVAAFEWLEQKIGPYRFGDHAGTVSVNWGPGAFGGMEHHPFWHVGAAALSSQETNVHEAVHGWFGGGIRIACWEDFVLSEGTTTYLAGRVLDVVAPTVGAATWQSYAQELAGLDGSAPVWPASCGAVDVIEDNLFTRAPYIRGAYFYRAVAERVGAAQLDAALAAFYAEHAGKAATMADMLTTIRTVTGFDPASCAESWLRSTTIPAPGPCP
jgi:aminopeptidase N